MMDPLSALSIAASVVQFVQFGASLVSKTHEIYASNEGTLAMNVQVEVATRRLIDLVDSLRDPSFAGSSLPLVESQSLQNICNKCVSISNELFSRLDKLMVHDAHTYRKWKSFRQALKSVWSKDGIEAIRKRLEVCKDELDIHLVVSIRNKVYDSSLQQSQAFASLDRKTQLCIQSLLDNRNFLDQNLSKNRDILLETVQYEHTVTRNAVVKASTSQKKLELTPAEIELRVIDELRQSLRFPTMIDRREAISQAHSETFKWIFRPPPDNDISWSNFIQWLECGTDIYWVNGKAGSGKSTLMRYILENPKTLKHLRSSGDKIEVLGFFFWNSGSAEQRSQNGLLRTLLFETLQRYPHLSSQLFPDEWAMNFSAARKGQAMTWQWTERRLHQAFRLLTNFATASLKFCFFIDGLDEYEGDHETIAHLFKDISSAPHIKICVSSRPLLVFEEAFQDFPGLRLQYLTSKDIYSYVRHEFQDHPRMVQLAELEPKHALDLATEIVTKASGVFLWVKLVIKSLLSGLRNRDDISDLNRRLRDIPADIEALYKHMLSCIEPLYKEKAFRTFEIFKVMSRDREPFINGVSPLDLNLAVTATLTETLAREVEVLDDIEIEMRREQMDIWLKTRCAGLLEVYDLGRSIGPPSVLQHAWNIGSTSKVQYLHRTVREFLETDEARIMLSKSSRQDATLEANREFLMSYIIGLKRREHYSSLTDKSLHNRPFNPTDQVLTSGLETYLKCAWGYIQAAEDDSAAYVALLDQLDSVATGLWERHHKRFRSHSVSHWSAGVSSGVGYNDDENCNFLSEVVERGLCSYVEAKMKKDKSIVMRKNGLPLLSHALKPHLPTSKFPPSYSYGIIRLLLQNGADPNLLWRGNSPWQRALTEVHKRCLIHHCKGIITLNDVSEAGIQTLRFWASVIKLLLEHGASPYTTCTYNHFFVDKITGIHSVADVIKDAFQKLLPQEASALLQLLEQKKLEYCKPSEEGKGYKRRLVEECRESDKRRKGAWRD